MPEEYGMKVWLEMKLKNIKQIKKEVQEKLKDVDLEGILAKGRSAGGIAKKVGGMAKAGGLGEGLGKLAATAGAILGVLFVIKKGVQRVWTALKQNSPYLQGILSVMNRAMGLFWRPFGDFLATLLRPLAIAMLKMAVKWLQFTRTPAGKAAVSTVSKAAMGGAAGAGIGTVVGGVLAGPLGALVGALAGAGIGAIAVLIPDALKGIKNIFIILSAWAKELAPKVAELAGRFMDWLWSGLKKIWAWRKDLAGWLWDKIQGIWNYAQDFGNFLWNKLKTIWNYRQSFGTWLWQKLKSAWNYTRNFGNWLWGKLKGIWNYRFDFGGWLKGKLKSVWNWITGGGDEGNQRGLRFVPETGIYKLHRGEEVVTASRSGKQGGSIVINPTFNIIGGANNTESEIRSQVRSATRMLEFAVRRRTFI